MTYFAANVSLFVAHDDTTDGLDRYLVLLTNHPDLKRGEIVREDHLDELIYAGLDVRYMMGLEIPLDMGPMGEWWEIDPTQPVWWRSSPRN